MAGLAVRARPGGNPRGEDTRQRILRTALAMFGACGFDGTSTRALAERAGVNLPAIQYYFGSKEGLYRAVVQEIIERIEERAGSVAVRIRAALRGRQLARPDLLGLLCDLMDVLVSLILDESLTNRDSCRRFFAQVEIEQNPTIDALHACIEQNILAPGVALIGRLMQRPADDEAVRMCAVAMLGQVKAFGTWGSDRVLGWHSADGERVRAVQALLRRHVMAIFGSEHA